MKCCTAFDKNGAIVRDAHDQGQWRDVYRLCSGDVPLFDDADEVTCPECGEAYIRLSALDTDPAPPPDDEPTPTP